MIEVSHISKNFGTFKAVDDISFSIPTGQIVGLLGPNGAGKTTTMRMITGFLENDDGLISIDGKNIKENPVEAKSKIGYMPEAAPLYSDMIVDDYLRFVANMQGEDENTKVEQLAKTCGLKEVMHKNISELSRGYRQRVGLAHALMHDPEILILDEPTSGLDPNQIEEVRALIREIGKTRTVIISTHILGEVETLCDRVIIISKGKLVADSPTEELREKYGNANNIKLTVSDCTLTALKKVLSEIDGVKSVSKFESKEVVEIKKATSVLVSYSDGFEVRPDIVKAIVKNKWNVFELTMQKNSLEEIFHSLTLQGDDK